MKKFSKILAVILAIATICSLTVVAAFAEGDTQTGETTQPESTATYWVYDSEGNQVGTSPADLKTGYYMTVMGDADNVLDFEIREDKDGNVIEYFYVTVNITYIEGYVLDAGAGKEVEDPNGSQCYRADKIAYAFYDLRADSANPGEYTYVTYAATTKTMEPVLDPETNEPVLDPETGLPMQQEVVVDNIANFMLNLKAFFGTKSANSKASKGTLVVIYQDIDLNNTTFYSNSKGYDFQNAYGGEMLFDLNGYTLSRTVNPGGYNSWYFWRFNAKGSSFGMVSTNPGGLFYYSSPTGKAYLSAPQGSGANVNETFLGEFPIAGEAFDAVRDKYIGIGSNLTIECDSLYFAAASNTTVTDNVLYIKGITYKATGVLNPIVMRSQVVMTIEDVTFDTTAGINNVISYHGAYKSALLEGTVIRNSTFIMKEGSSFFSGLGNCGAENRATSILIEDCVFTGNLVNAANDWVSTGGNELTIGKNVKVGSVDFTKNVYEVKDETTGDVLETRYFIVPAKVSADADETYEFINANCPDTVNGAEYQLGFLTLAPADVTADNVALVTWGEGNAAEKWLVGSVPNKVVYKEGVLNVFDYKSTAWSKDGQALAAIVAGTYTIEPIYGAIENRINAETGIKVGATYNNGFSLQVYVPVHDNIVTGAVTEVKEDINYSVYTAKVNPAVTGGITVEIVVTVDIDGVAATDTYTFTYTLADYFTAAIADCYTVDETTGESTLTDEATLKLIVNAANYCDAVCKYVGTASKYASIVTANAAYVNAGVVAEIAAVDAPVFSDKIAGVVMYIDGNHVPSFAFQVKEGATVESIVVNVKGTNYTAAATTLANGATVYAISGVNAADILETVEVTVDGVATQYNIANYLAAVTEAGIPAPAPAPEGGDEIPVPVEETEVVNNNAAAIAVIEALAGYAKLLAAE